ncbi:unnamed protein product [Sphagnum jensenii]|uniref:SAP30-binding protein n=1 Tax=Sphagnum jensenii TaxID=128206 RepID=A0ABP1AM25_9BRYO
MAAGRRDAEGIALLSVVYGDLDSDDDLEDAAASPPPLTTAIPGDGEAAGSSIVDYAHDEAAASPEHEERETVGDGSVAVGDGDDIEVDNGQGLFCLSGKELTPSRDEGEAETSVVQDSLDNSVNPHTAEQDPLAGFLPSPPHTLCSDELKAKFTKYSKLKEAGRSFNEDLRNSKGYRNPDFLQHAVTHENIDQIGSCFRPDIFNPHGYEKIDFFDALVAMQRRGAERTQSQRSTIDFARPPSAAGLLSDPRPKPIMPILTGQKAGFTGVTVIATHGLGEASQTTINTTTSAVTHTAITTEVSVKNEFRAGKKSKWDKATNH